MSPHRNPFLPYTALTGLDIASQLRSSMRALQGVAGLDRAAQLQSSMKAFQGVAGLAGLDRAAQLQSSMKAFQGIAGLAGLDRVAPLQSFMKAFQGVAGLAGLDWTVQLQSSMKAFQSVAGLDKHSTAGQLGLFAVASGMFGPTAALGAMASLTAIPVHETKVASFFSKLEHIVEPDTTGEPSSDTTGEPSSDTAGELSSDTTGEPSSVEEAVFDLPAWSKLASRLQAWLKLHHVALFLALVAAVHQQVAFAYSQRSSDAEAAVADHRTQAAAEQHDDIARQLGKLSKQLERAIAQLTVLQQDFARSAADSVDGAQDGSAVERRIVTQTARIHIHPRSKAAVGARVPVGEAVFVFEHQRKWLYIGYSDVVTGRPVTGWVLKKYTRRLSSTNDVVLFAPGGNESTRE